MAKLALCLINMHYAKKTMDVKIHVFLILALVVGEWSPSRPVSFILGERPPPPPVPVQYATGWEPELNVISHLSILGSIVF
jgi:hypothetical protein